MAQTRTGRPGPKVNGNTRTKARSGAAKPQNKAAKPTRARSTSKPAGRASRNGSRRGAAMAPRDRRRDARSKAPMATEASRPRRLRSPTPPAVQETAFVARPKAQKAPCSLGVRHSLDSLAAWYWALHEDRPGSQGQSPARWAFISDRKTSQRRRRRLDRSESN